MSDREAQGIKKTGQTGLEIAVIGMAARFPGARNIEQYWQNLQEGKETVTFFTREELIEAGVSPRLVDHPNYVNARGYLEDTEYFDAAFFGYTPAEARLMDPQLRFYHECTWEALEDAGCDPGRYPGLIGVYSGAHPNISWISGIIGTLTSASERFDIYNLNSSPSFGTRISFNLNLKGPSFNVQTACSTSLVSIHLGCQGLLNAECDIALAGGVSISSDGKGGYIYQEGMINSPDGHCRAFDAKAGGTLRGNGAGVVVLKRLEDALAEGDHIYAIVKGSAINNDGNRKIGYSAPSVEGQADVIKAAMEIAEVEAESISYIETHGTGTSLGDPIEIEGLKLAFNTDKRGFCAIGAVKSNFGHLDNAAGVAGFIKAVLTIYHRMIPPSLHYERPNPKIDFENSPFYVNMRLQEWHNEHYPLRAGVSSFGIGGTNAHMILEEAPGENDGEEGDKCRAQQLIVLSARTRDSLQQAVSKLGWHLQAHPGVNFADVVYTLQAGRKTFKYRAFAVCSTISEAGEILTKEALENGRLPVLASVENDLPVIFMFSGQGAQYVDMGLELYRTERVFQEEMDRCFAILRPIMGYDLKGILYPAEKDGNRGQEISPTGMDVNQTEVTQPLVFVFEYALAQLLASWGIEPAAMIGHSIGEYTAACLAGVLSLEDALSLVALRGKLMQGMPPGAMLSVSLPEKELLPLLPVNLSLAAVNGPGNCVVSGEHEHIEALARELEKKGYNSRPLHTSHAFHSRMMEPILKEFQERVKSILFNQPGKSYISNVSGTWITHEQVLDPGYWSAHLRGTVRFFAGLSTLLEKYPDAVIVEVGPGRVLSTLARQHPGKKPQQLIVNLVRHPQEEQADDLFLMNKLGQLWQKGVIVNWQGFHQDEERRKVSLPTYSFERQAYPFPVFRSQPVVGKRGAAELRDEPVKPVKNRDISRWFYLPSWKGVWLPGPSSITLEPGGRWLIFIETSGLGMVLVNELRRLQQEVIPVIQGEEFRETSGEIPGFSINPHNEDDYDALWNILKSRNWTPGRVIHGWTVTGLPVGCELDDIEPMLHLGFYSLLNLVRASARQRISESFEIDVLSTHMHNVTGNETLNPVQSLLLGPVRIIPREYKHIRCRSIDIPWHEEKEKQGEIIKELLQELSGGREESLVALRNNRRWVQQVEPAHFNYTESSPLKLKKQGVYLVTGGLGGIGLVLAEALASQWQPRLILTGRSAFPGPGEWQAWLDSHPAFDEVSRKIILLQAMERKGAEMMICQADVANPVEMAEVVRRGVERFGTIQGVIHTAGVPDGAIIQARGQKITENVFLPKVKGTMVLNQLFSSYPLDFFFICSSISAILSPIGQVGYCAANSFQDAFAQYRVMSGHGFTLSINWDTWVEVGMAVNEAMRNVEIIPVSHPLLEGCVIQDAKNRHYFGTFNPGRLWVLDEHRIQGKATLPGTGYLDMIGGVFEDLTGKKNYEIRDLLFLTPLMVEDEEKKTVNIIIHEESQYYTFKVFSQTSGQWREHARGQVYLLEQNTGPGANRDINEYISRCSGTFIVPTGVKGQKDGDQQFLVVGPRWNNIKTVRYGEKEGLAEIKIDEAYAADLVSFPLHPAMMDCATSFMLGRYGKGKPFLPFFIKRVKVYGPLEEKVYSYAVPVDAPIPMAPGRENLRFNITLMDTTGHVRVEVDEFTLVHVTTEEKPAVSSAEVKRKEEQPVVSSVEGILSAEGVEVFKRMMAGAPPQVIVSTTDFHERVRYIEFKSRVPEKEKENTLEETEETSDEVFGHPRPELTAPYVAPVNDIQKKLVRIWGRLLGIDNIGIQDDFFELGGDSLKGLTVVAEISKHLKIEISITDMFTYPNIEALSRTLYEGKESKYSEIEPVEEKEYYPLSSAQHRLYFLQQLRKDSVFYNIPQAKMVEGEIDVQRFEAAFAEVVRRHESLRTIFLLVDGEPVQSVCQEVEFKVEYLDAQIEGKTAKGELREIVRAFVRPFDLSRAPLLRVGLVKVEAMKYLWIFDIHHISADATGFSIVQNDFFKLYNGEALPQQKVQYKDFSSWQNRLFETGQIKKQEDYWLNVYADPVNIPKLNLPTDFPRPEFSKFQGDLYSFMMGKAETEGLKGIDAKAGTTLFINLMTVLYILLYKYTGQDDIVIGSSIAGRPHADLMTVVGMFVNMLAIRCRLTESMTYWELLAQVKKLSLEAFENQDMQFEMLVEKLNLDISSSRNPLFDICLNFQNYSDPSFKTLKGLKVSPFGAEYRNAKFDMIVWAADMGEQLRFAMEYSTELFKRSTIEEFTNHLLEIVKQVVANRDIRLKDIKISHKVVKPKAAIPQIDFGF